MWPSEHSWWGRFCLVRHNFSTSVRTGVEHTQLLKPFALPVFCKVAVSILLGAAIFFFGSCPLVMCDEYTFNSLKINALTGHYPLATNH